MAIIASTEGTVTAFQLSLDFGVPHINKKARHLSAAGSVGR